MMFRETWDLPEAAKAHEVAGYSQSPDGAGMIYHDAFSSTVEPEVPEDWSPGRPRKTESVEGPPDVEDVTASCAPKLSSDLNAGCGSISLTPLLDELQIQREVLQQSIDDVFDAMEHKMKCSLQQERHHESSDQVASNSSLLPPAAARKKSLRKAYSHLTEASVCTDLEDPPALALHQKSTTNGNRTAHAVTSDADLCSWDSATAKFQEIGGYKEPQGGVQGGCQGFFPRIRALTDHKYFELTFAALILMHTCTMTIESQYQSLDVCLHLGYPNCERPKEEIWPGADMAFWTLEMIFGVLFTSEVCLKLLGQHMYFMFSAWNCLDFFIILGWLVTTMSNTELGMNPMLVRLARIARLLRFLRLVKTIQMFDVLQLLIGSLRASGLILFWSAVVLAIIMICAALLAHNLMLTYLQDENIDMETRHDVYRVFGSFARSFLTMYQMTFSLDTPAPGLCFELNEWFAIPLVMYQSLVSFAVIKVIEAVFLNETIKLAATDDELMIMEKKRWEAMHEEKVHALFQEADESGDGLIDYAEFMTIMNDDRVTTWLEAMEVQVTDPKMVWDLMCSFSGLHVCDTNRLSAHWFVKGMARLKGGAKSLDLLAMLRELEALSAKMQTLDRKLRHAKTPLVLV
eukprot:TRINITY_DN4923_c0_g1_i3.p1 TRINITY_DN4923_c0_g1~~TRINITY_DN4923_c0_g1_i3.p1  ORF type:complete len:631 (-),score=92.59 TRINITY_DN4923_c0_g1_i3:234-2126(-)